jgi:Arc/MetJ-type ribon-helix-helix transcriptional regulator
METIQVVLGSKLLRATDVAARRGKLNRSALIREALRAHLKNLEITRGDIRLYRCAAPDNARAVVVLTRDNAL